MANEETTSIQDPFTFDLDILEKSSTTSINDQPGLLGGTVQSVSVPTATEANSSETETHRVDVPSSDDTTLSNGASGSTADASHGVGGVQEDEQHPTEDDPSNPLIAPRYGIGFPIRVVDYETFEPPPPPRPSWIQCMFCCFLTAYYIHYARKIRNSKYLTRVWIPLMLIPFSALYFGLSNVTFCPLASISPILLTLLGLLGISLIVVRAKAVAVRLWGIENPPKTAAIGLTILLMILMITEMVKFYTKYPNFDNTKDPVYCTKTFYYYVYYMNFVVMVLGILALLLHIPMKPSDPVQVVPLKYFETI